MIHYRYCISSSLRVPSGKDEERCYWHRGHVPSADHQRGRVGRHVSSVSSVKSVNCNLISTYCLMSPIFCTTLWGGQVIYCMWVKVNWSSVNLLWILHLCVSSVAISYDRRLGGVEFALRLRDHLAKVFNAQKKTKIDVTTNTRAMAKLLKEANRVKHVLSANNEHYAQVTASLWLHFPPNTPSMHIIQLHGMQNTKFIRWFLWEWLHFSNSWLYIYILFYHFLVILFRIKQSSVLSSFIV